MTNNATTGTDDTARVLVTVLQSFPPPRPTTNPYLRLLVRALPADVRVEFFSWRTALTGRYDVFHVHWPETMLRSASRPRALARKAAMLLLLGVLRLRRVAVVRTLHNPHPHEQAPAVDRLLLRALDRATRWWVRLNAFTPTPDPSRTSTVLHGHYRDWFGAAPLVAPEPGRLLCFGLLRPYKGIETLLGAFTRVEDDSLTLRIVGAATTAPLARTVTMAAEQDARIGARLEYVDDTTLRDEIAAAELVVLPYRELHNSGAALLALSLDRPVLLPAGDVSAALAQEVGPGWVQQYTGELSAQALEDALAAVRAGTRNGRPDLSGRDWTAAGTTHRQAYLAARDAARDAARSAARGHRPRSS